MPQRFRTRPTLAGCVRFFWAHRDGADSSNRRFYVCQAAGKGKGADQWRGGFGDRPASPLPRCFGCWRSAELWPTEACLPAGQGAGNSRRKSATKERRRDISCTAGPDEGGARPAGADTYNPTGQQQNRKTLLQPERSEARAVGLGLAGRGRNPESSGSTSFRATL
jgi:hypothetical protein